MYYSYKRIGPISTGHRQYKADSHCRWITWLWSLC